MSQSDPSSQQNINSTQTANMSFMQEGANVSAVNNVSSLGANPVTAAFTSHTEQHVSVVNPQLPTDLSLVNGTSTTSHETSALQTHIEQKYNGVGLPNNYAPPVLLPGLPISPEAEDKKAGGKWTPEVNAKYQF